MIPIEPFEAEVEVVDENRQRVWMPCTVVGIREGSLRYELIVLYPFNGNMMTAMSCDDVRIRAIEATTSAPIH